ncbi:MAG: hypothetical protein AAFY71_02160 [Bacteroidota bacterium]
MKAHNPICLLFILLLPFLMQAQGNRNNTLWAADWSKNGRYMAVGGDDQILRVFDGKSYELIFSDTLEGDIHRLRWHPTENLLAVAGTGKAPRIVDFDWGRTIELDQLEELSGRALAWSPAGDTLALGGYEKAISLWDKKGNLLREIPAVTGKSIVAIDWNPNNGNLIVLSEYVYEYTPEGQIVKKFRHRDEVVLMLTLAFHPSGDFYVIGDYGDFEKPYPPVLQYWFRDHQLDISWKKGKAEFRNVVWDRKGKKLATASDALRVFDRKGKLLHEGLSPDKLWGVAWDKKGKRILTSSEKGVIAVWTKKAKLKQVILY